MIWAHLFGDQVGATSSGTWNHGVRILPAKTLPDGGTTWSWQGSASRRTSTWRRRPGLPTTGVLADDHLQAAPDIWAAGDIAEYQSVIHGRRIRIEHWDVALNHGGYIGKSGRARRTSLRGRPLLLLRPRPTGHGWSTSARARDDAVEVRGSMADDDFVAYYSDADGKLTACLAVNRSDESTRPRS